MTAPGRRYVCEVCGGTFVSERSELDGLAEARDVWPDLDTLPLAQVCDRCYREIMAWAAEDPERLRP